MIHAILYIYGDEFGIITVMTFHNAICMRCVCVCVCVCVKGGGGIRDCQFTDSDLLYENTILC